MHYQARCPAAESRHHRAKPCGSPIPGSGTDEQDLYHVKVEIDVSVAGQTSTYIFNCIHSGALTVIQPLGMR